MARDRAQKVLEELEILELFEFKVDEFPYRWDNVLWNIDFHASHVKFRKFYYDFDDMKIVNKSGYVKHYLAEIEKRGKKSDQRVAEELKKLDNEFQTEDKNWSLLHQARQLFENDGKSKFLLSYNSLVDLGYCGYSGYYC